jgi:hypothetical protein
LQQPVKQGVKQYASGGGARENKYTPTDDQAKRCADVVTLHAVAGNAGQWCAIRLIDGGSDNQVYDTRENAQKYQLNPEFCTYILIPPSGMEVQEAKAVLAYWRALALSGIRGDRTDVQWPLMPLLAADRRKQIDALVKGRN